MKNKFLAFVVVMCMALTMIPGVAMAGSTDSCTDPCAHEAKVGTTHYDTLEEAIRAANGTSGTVVLLKDVTRATWHQWGTSNDDVNYPTLNNITIDGNGNSLTVTTITSASNGNRLTYGATNTTIKNLTVTAPNGFDLASGSKLENCTINNATYGVLVGYGVTITGCTFNNCSHGIYTNDYGASTDVVIRNNTFNCKRATILRTNEQFTGNTLTAACTSGVTVSSTASSTVTDNTFEEGSRMKLYPSAGATSVAPTISGNTISGSVEVEGGGAYDITGNTITETANVPDNVTHDPVTTTKPASSYSGPNIWYEGGNTFGTSTTQVPTEVKIDGVVVPFTMNGSKVTVGCVNPNADWVTVKWGSTTNTINFTPDAAAECTTVAIPKTGDMPIWAAVLALFGF